MTNNLIEKPDQKNTNVIYTFTCPINECFHHPKVNYIGTTVTTISMQMIDNAA